MTISRPKSAGRSEQAPFLKGMREIFYDLKRKQILMYQLSFSAIFLNSARRQNQDLLVKILQQINIEGVGHTFSRLLTSDPSLRIVCFIYPV